MENSEKKEKISHSITILYYVGSIFPLLSVISAWIVFYSMGHFEKGRILTISSTMCPFPEKRIFACTMNVEAVLLFVIYYIRITFIQLQQKNINKELSFYYKPILYLLYICFILTPFGLTLLAASTSRDGPMPHFIGAGVFFVGCAVFNVFSDFLLRYVNVQVPIWSMILSWVNVGCLLVYFIGANLAKSVAVENMCNFFQYLTAITNFSKVFCYQFDIPKHKITIEKV